MKDFKPNYTSREWLLGAICYSTAGYVSLLEMFGCAVYRSVSNVIWIAGIEFRRAKRSQ